MASDALLELPGVGPVTATALTVAGFGDPAAVAAATVAELSQVPGIGPARASSLIDAAKRAEDDAPVIPSPNDGPAESVRERSGKKARRRLGKEIEALRAKRSAVKAEIRKARKRLEKASSKRKRRERRDELAKLRRKSKKLRRRITELTERLSERGS